MSDRNDVRTATACDEALLARLGFGPDTALMNDPKLFVDRSFLAALLAEFQSELGVELAGAALFQIGLAHGLREAEVALQQGFAGGPGEGALPRSTSLALALGPTAPGFRLSGHWPDVHEAEARLQRVGLSTAPSCHLSAGYTSGWLSVTTERELVVVETECIATGGVSCQFEAREPRAWLDDPRSRQIAGVDLRQGLFAHRPQAPNISPAAPSSPSAANAPMPDGSDKAVHVWGPVMVLPYTFTEEVLATIDMLGRSDETRGVRVVVIDLSEAVLDEGFAAAGLEQSLDAIEQWGAEAILAGVSTINQPIVDGLDSHHMVTHKALPDAIAMAFQITEAQRHAL